MNIVHQTNEDYSKGKCNIPLYLGETITNDESKITCEFCKDQFYAPDSILDIKKAAEKINSVELNVVNYKSKLMVTSIKRNPVVLIPNKKVTKIPHTTIGITNNHGIKKINIPKKTIKKQFPKFKKAIYSVLVHYFDGLLKKDIIEKIKIIGSKKKENLLKNFQNYRFKVSYKHLINLIIFDRENIQRIA